MRIDRIFYATIKYNRKFLVQYRLVKMYIL